MTNKEKINGIIPPTVIPLKEDETLDRCMVEKLVDYCIEGGVKGLFCNGTSGEAMRVTDEVWMRNMEATLEFVKGRVPVFCGAIDSSTLRTIERVKAVEKLGGDYAVCTPPFYLPSFGQDEILRHFDEICEKTSIDIIIYNIPETTRANILPETIKKMADWGRIAAYKDSSADYQQLQRELMVLENKDISLLNGAEELCAVAMLFGAQGCIPGLANFLPGTFVELYCACERKDIEKSYQLQKQIVEVRKVLQVGGCWMSVMKYLLQSFALGEEWVSAPLRTLDEGEKRLVHDILSRNKVSCFGNRIEKG